MTLRERLSARLAEVGITVLPADFQPARGHYRTSSVVDSYRWEAPATYRGIGIWICSYDRMKDCARHGVHPLGESSLTYEIDARWTSR